jgi:hypothetical protein
MPLLLLLPRLLLLLPCGLRVFVRLLGAGFAAPA